MDNSPEKYAPEGIVVISAFDSRIRTANRRYIRNAATFPTAVSRGRRLVETCLAESVNRRNRAPSPRQIAPVGQN